jgi:hypothetical protein
VYVYGATNHKGRHLEGDARWRKMHGDGQEVHSSWGVGLYGVRDTKFTDYLRRCSLERRRRRSSARKKKRIAAIKIAARMHPMMMPIKTPAEMNAVRGRLQKRHYYLETCSIAAVDQLASVRVGPPVDVPHFRYLRKLKVGISLLCRALCSKW